MPTDFVLCPVSMVYHILIALLINLQLFAVFQCFFQLMCNLNQCKYIFQSGRRAKDDPIL